MGDKGLGREPRRFRAKIGASAAITIVLQQPIDATALTFTLEKDSITARVGRWKLKTTKTQILK